MTKNISTKTANKGGHKTDKKSSSQANTKTTNANTNHSQNETTNTAPVQKASIDSKMLTPEQRRLASLMNDKVDVTDIEKKVNKIIELTGASKDKAIVALHDCANELEKAIDMILEGDSINESEWKSQARKKKPKTLTGKEADNKVQLNGHSKKSKATGRQPRNNKQQNDKQFTNRPERTNNKKEFKQREQNNNDESTNNKETIPKNETAQQNEEENDDWQDENQSQQQQSNKPSFNNRTSSTNDNQFKSSFKSSTQDRKPNREYNNRDYNNREGQRGDRNYNNRSSYNQSGDRQFNQRSDRKFPNKNYPPRKPTNERNQFPNSIDTWTNDSTNQPTTNNDYAQMTVGNWSDVVSSKIQQKTAVSASSTVITQDKLNNEEWVEKSSSLIEQTSTVTKVFKDSQNNTASNQATINKEEHQQTKMPNLASIVSGVKPMSQVQHPTPQQQSSLNKSPNQKTTINQLSGVNQTASSNNNHPQLASQSNLHKSSQQRSPQQNKIDLAALLKSPANQQQQQSNQQTTTSNLLNRTNNIPQPQRSGSDSNAYGAALLQHLQRPQMGNNEANKSSNINDYVSQYNNQQMINKNLVHNIPSNNNNFSQNSSNQLFDNRLHHQNVNDQQTIQDHHQKSLIDKTKRKHTKIPETAVEMPSSDHISSLNVQFGALDFGTDSYLNDNNDKQQNSSILSSIRGDNQFRNQNQNQSTTTDKQHQQSKDMLHNQLDQHQLQDNILLDNRNKQQQQASYQQQKTSASSLYGSNQTSSNDNNSSHQSIYPPNLAQQYGYSNTTSNASANNQSNYSVNNYGQQNQQHSNNQNQTANQSANQQKIDQQQTSSNTSGQKLNLKDLDITSSNSNTNSNSNLINTSLGTAVTTNVLKNSITATGKNIQQGNVAQQPNVAPLLGTPQYIMNMSQPGLSAFYPIVNYDVPQMTADHSFRYNQNQQDVKYNRTDANDNVGQTNPHNVQSTQAQVNQQPNHQIFSQIGQFPHPYGFFYTTGMMAQGLYPSTAPFLPVQPNAGPPSSNQHTNSSHSTGFPPKAGQNQQYSSYSSNAYDPLTAQLQNQQDYNKAAAQQNYGNAPTQTSNNQQTGKQMSNSSANELNNSNMYTKSHAQLTKNYDKPGFQTPPPFGITQLSYNPNTYIPMMQPQSNPSMLHHTLQTDANQSVNSSVTGSQRGSLSQKQTASNSKSNYYNNW